MMRHPGVTKLSPSTPRVEFSLNILLVILAHETRIPILITRLANPSDPTHELVSDVVLY